MSTTNHMNAGKRQNWATPWHVFNAIEAKFGRFQLDVCAKEWNAKVPNYYGLPDKNGLKEPWSPMNYCNPPFNNIKLWVVKAIEEATYENETVMLVKTSFGSQYFKQHVWPNADVYFLTGRIAFDLPPGEVNPKRPLYDCAVYHFRPFKNSGHKIVPFGGLS